MLLQSAGSIVMVGNMNHPIFIDRKPTYYSVSNQTQDLTEPQFYERYAPSD